MKIYDISQEVFGCVVFPGDPKPERTKLAQMAEGSLYNLTAFSMCAHNGTHVDAPFHFLPEGKTVEQLALDVFVGECFVAWHEGVVTGADALTILDKADGVPRILIAGKATVTEEAAAVFASQQFQQLRHLRVRGFAPDDDLYFPKVSRFQRDLHGFLPPVPCGFLVASLYNRKFGLSQLFCYPVNFTR